MKYKIGSKTSSVPPRRRLVSLLAKTLNFRLNLDWSLAP